MPMQLQFRTRDDADMAEALQLQALHERATTVVGGGQVPVRHASRAGGGGGGASIHHSRSEPAINPANLVGLMFGTALVAVISLSYARITLSW